VFMGTVPANEDLRLNSVICPCCGKVFHRWGHVRSFSEKSLRATLASGFATVQVDDRFFTPWTDLDPRRILEALVPSGDPRPSARRSVGSWTRENWRPLLSSVPRLAARRVGVEFPSNLAFFAQGAV
jgi:hypothetical protein